MGKYIILFRGDAPDGHYALAGSVLDTASRLAEDSRVSDVWVTHTFASPPRSLLPLRNGPVACLSIIAAEAIRTDLTKTYRIPEHPGFAGLYTASEAQPVTYKRTWPEGTQTPGVCLLTLFHRKPGIGYRVFLHRWHVGHTGLSLRLHPLWHYNRNVVHSLVSAGSELDGRYDGIVEEHFRTARDLLNPFRFYGRSHVILWNMLTILVDILGFIDLRRIETYLTKETILRSSEPRPARSIPTDADRARDHAPAHPSPSRS